MRGGGESLALSTVAFSVDSTVTSVFQVFDGCTCVPFCKRLSYEVIFSRICHGKSKVGENKRNIAILHPPEQKKKRTRYSPRLPSHCHEEKNRQILFPTLKISPAKARNQNTPPIAGTSSQCSMFSTDKLVLRVLDVYICVPWLGRAVRINGYSAPSRLRWLPQVFHD